MAAVLPLEVTLSTENGLSDRRNEMTNMSQGFASRGAHRVVLALTIVLLSGGYAHAQQKRVVPGPKELPYSEGVVVGNTLYIAGQGGTDESGKLKPGGIGPETQATLENLAKVVNAAGFELKDVVAVTVYLADLKEFSEMNKVYRKIHPRPQADAHDRAGCRLVRQCTHRNLGNSCEAAIA
jgi:2-iminobutanoate/2-iminopropanoate deaminase